MRMNEIKIEGIFEDQKKALQYLMNLVSEKIM